MSHQQQPEATHQPPFSLPSDLPPSANSGKPGTARQFRYLMSGPRNKAMPTAYVGVNVGRTDAREARCTCTVTEHERSERDDCPLHGADSEFVLIHFQMRSGGTRCVAWSGRADWNDPLFRNLSLDDRQRMRDELIALAAQLLRRPVSGPGVGLFDDEPGDRTKGGES